MASQGILIALMAAALASAANALVGHAGCKRTVSVTGTGSVGVMTTIAVVRLGVEVRGATAGEVQTALAAQANKLVAFLRAQSDVTRLQTSGISLNERFDFTKRPPVKVGFQGSNTVSFEVPVGRAGALLDGAVKNGATRISGIAFKATDKVVADARDEAIRQAVVKAKREAGVAAMAAGRRLGRTTTIAIQDSFVASPRFARAASSDSASTPVVAQEQQVTARVAVTYETL